MDGLDESQDTPTPEERVREARDQKKQAATERPAVDKIVARLTLRLAENHFADRLYQQLIDSWRRA